MTKKEIEDKIEEVERALAREERESSFWSGKKTHHDKMSKILVSSRDKQLKELYAKLKEIDD